MISYSPSIRPLKICIISDESDTSHLYVVIFMFSGSWFSITSQKNAGRQRICMLGLAFVDKYRSVMVFLRR